MSNLISNFVFFLTATFLLGAFISWLIWGRRTNKQEALLESWRSRYLSLDKEYQSIAGEYSQLESELSARAARVGNLNDEKNEITGKLTASKALLHEADKEIDQLKKQLGQTTAHLQVASKELDINKQKLNSLSASPKEIQELKTLLGEATKRYNKNGLELKNKQEQYTSLENKFDETTKRMTTLNRELEHLRTQLLKRDKEFKNQIVLFSNLKNQYDENSKLLASTQEELKSAAKQNNQNAEIQIRDEKIAALQQKLAASIEIASSMEEEVGAIKERIPTFENKLKQRNATIAALENEITHLSKELPPLRDKVALRDQQITDLKQEVHVLEQKVPAFQNTISARDAHIRELEIFIQDAQKAILKPTGRNGTSNGNGSSSNGTTNGNGHSHTLNGNVVHINGNGKANGQNGHVHSRNSNGDTKPNLINKPNGANGKSTNQKNAKSKIKSYGLNKPTRKPDDLKLISGIGVTLEKTLHKYGIYYFEQIAGFSRKDVTAVDDMLNFKGRIDRDEWIKQAKILLRGGTYTRKKATKRNTPKKRRIKSLGMKRPSGELDDLQLINGVGPKLERKLHRLGVYHYEQIAAFTAEDIEVLDSKLKTYRGRVKRDKWPLQARRLHKEFHLNA